MRPARLHSKWVKILPWYYTEKNEPSRAEYKRRAIEDDEAASGEDADDES